MPPRVLFVSKPIVPPFRDGTKCLVRDVALHLTRVDPVVMSTSNAVPLEHVESVPVYATAGGFAPALRDNARAALYLMTRARADVWHFVFAPNPRTSRVARALSMLRRVPVVQTVASPPREFVRVERLLFGDRVVAQSRWTAERLREALGSERAEAVRVIPPPLGALREPTPEAILAQRRELGIGAEAPVFVYPGDLEVSGGAEAVAAAVGPVLGELPDAVFVFACRAKTPEAPRLGRALVRRIGEQHARFTSDPSDLLALLAGATAVLFPVDDLWGKVDLPIVLLETMALGTPVVAYDQGPLQDLHGTWLIAPGDPAALVSASLQLARDPSRRGALVSAQRAAVRERFAAPVVARAYEGVYEELVRSGPPG